jgi:hypothetical protein
MVADRFLTPDRTVMAVLYCGGEGLDGKKQEVVRVET